MKTVILIAVRLHSTRLPRKALIEIGGKTILEHLVDNLRLAREPDDIVMCTSVHGDDEELLRLARSIGLKSFAGAQDDVLDRFIKAAERENADCVVRVTGDNPLTCPETMDKMIHLHKREKAEYTYTEDTPRGTRCEILSLNAMRRAHRLAEDPSKTEYMTLYFKQPEHFRISKFTVAEESCKRPEYRLTIDTAEDLEVIRLLYSSIYEHAEKRWPRLEKIIEFLDQHSEIVAINSLKTPKWESMQINARLRQIPPR